MHSRIDHVALQELLNHAGLLEKDLSLQAARCARHFPAVVGRDMFVEYELGENRIASGFGLGFQHGLYDHYIATDHWFLKSSVGGAIETALSADPFKSDHEVYLNILSDGDPDWVEYDIDQGRLDETPFVFFRLPSRFQLISTPDQARGVCELLPDAGRNEQFATLLALLVGMGPAAMYRVGRAKQRGTGWWRAIISYLREDQVVAALLSLGASDFEAPLALARELYAGRADKPGACFALSIDVQDGGITAVDVECPYLFRLGDPAVRNSAFTDLAMQLVRHGTLSPATGDWLTSNGCCREIIAPQSGARMQVRVHHLKFRFLGSPHLRTKVYLHLEMTAPPAVESAA